MNEDLARQVAEVMDQLPIVHPRQLYLRKGDTYVESYDPVNEITINAHSIGIRGEKYVYNHSFDEFDKIYIVPNGDEPVVLTKES